MDWRGFLLLCHSHPQPHETNHEEMAMKNLFIFALATLAMAYSQVKKTFEVQTYLGATLSYYSSIYIPIFSLSLKLPAHRSSQNECRIENCLLKATSFTPSSLASRPSFHQQHHLSILSLLVEQKHRELRRQRLQQQPVHLRVLLLLA